MKSYTLNILISLIAGFIGAFFFTIFQDQIALYKAAKPNANINFVRNDSDSALLPGESGMPSPEKGKQAMIPRENFVEASRTSRQCVVYIKTLASENYERYSWFDLFFGGRGIPERQVMGSGSGVIFSEDGYIVTNNHVIDAANRIQVIYDKKTYEAKLVGTDPSTDLALLKIEAEKLPYIKISSSRNLAVGDWVLAVGNPFNLESTVTAGIVSAKGRRINILEDIFPIESFIQTDAAINPGNSGGALVNMDGELVGINTAILSKTGSYAGYGFAVPSDIVSKVVDDLRRYGEVQKAFMGVEAIDLTEELTQNANISELDGVFVRATAKDGAADQAGIEPGDVIVGINNRAVNSKADFDEILSYYRPGDKVQVKYKRGKETFVKELVLTNIEGTTGVVKKITYESNRLGAVFEIVPKIERLKLKVDNGIRIKKVERGLIREMELEEGFIITAINGYQIEKPEDLEEILSRIRGRVIVEGINKQGEPKAYYYRF